jgi:hypothetical protein
MYTDYPPVESGPDSMPHGLNIPFHSQPESALVTMWEKSKTMVRLEMTTWLRTGLIKVALFCRKTYLLVDVNRSTWLCPSDYLSAHLPVAPRHRMLRPALFWANIADKLEHIRQISANRVKEHEKQCHGGAVCPYPHQTKPS